MGTAALGTVGRTAHGGAALETIAWTGSDRAHAAVDQQFAAGDEAAVLRGQKQHRGGDLLGPRHAAERDVRGMLGAHGGRLLGRIDLGVNQRRVSRTRSDRVDPDAAVLELHRPGPGIGAQCGLGGGVGAATGEAAQGGDRAGQDDGCAIVRSGSDFCTVKSTPRVLTSKLWLKLSGVTSASFTLLTAPTLATTTSIL